jgi:hypothetical protein
MACLVQHLRLQLCSASHLRDPSGSVCLRHLPATSPTATTSNTAMSVASPELLGLHAQAFLGCCACTCNSLYALFTSNTCNAKIYTR